ncbi:hypothetical protein PHYPSEUDO_004742 [Phytophthora pseudosyringae]|uniref:COR domain-containing protein n=1 Tax=Phytophthora pseudosyringae TaxID=221518 RepID=A0A8T1VR76_9STRA|nr:hypothetical protein PHYPSEUDO_004742 [Phytophthora pseudosyringae]
MEKLFKRSRSITVSSYSIFYSQRTLFLLCVDLKEYARVLKTKNLDDDLDDDLELAQFFNDNILRWFRLMFARQPEAKVVLVGTKSDAESLTGDLIDSVQQDVSLRLEEWSQKIRSEMDAMVANAGKAEWLITSSKDTLVADRARQELERIVVSSNQGFIMPDKYFAVLQYVRGLRSQAEEKNSMEGRLKHIFRNDKALRRELRENGGDKAPTMADCKSIFQILHDLGDLLYFENTGIESLKSLVIVDPRVIVDLVRQIVRHDSMEEDHMAALQTRGLVPHVLLKTLPLWKDVKEELTFALKELLQHFRIAYPAGQSRMTPEADMIVPALWTLHEPVNQTSAQFEEALQGFRDASGDESLLTLNWEYEFPGDTLPESFYEEVVVESYHPHVQAVVLSDCIDLIQTGSFAARLLFRLEPTRSKIQIETAGYETSLAWNAMRFLVRAVELVLVRFPGIRADRYIAVKSGAHPNRFNLETVLNGLVRGEWIGNPTEYPEWMPADCDLQWFVDKAWDNSHYFSDIHNSMSTRQQLDRVDKKINMLRRMAIIGEENRELPALWTAERLPTRTGFMVRVKMLSDLSGSCFHERNPIDISVLPELIGAYGDWIQAGLSILSTVAPSGWIISSSDLHSALGIDNAIGKAVKVYNLIKGTSLKTSGFIDSDYRLDTQRSRDLLRKLLEIHCSGQFEPRDIRSLSHLNCGIIKNSGIHVWAVQDELEKYPDDITPRADFTSPTQMQAQIVGSLQGFLVIRRVTGLTDWDWREMYVEWQLVDGAGTQIASGRTSSNPDNSKAPQWSDKKHFPIDSIEDLRKMTLKATARRPSRWVFSRVK